MPPTSFAADGTEAALSVYDTTPLKATLEELVDFDLINRGQVRLSLGAVDVCKGTSTYFDTKNTLIHADHVRASGALPPGFPPVTIDGEHYWDGGVVTNTPITYVVDERPLPNIDNRTGFGKGYLHHLVRHDPRTEAMDDLGVLRHPQPRLLRFQGPPGEEPRRLAPPASRLPHPARRHADAAARHPGHDRHPHGTIYATVLAPFTLLKIETVKAIK